MLTKKITSLQHPLVKHWLNLRSDRSYREEAQRVLITGEKLVREIASAVGILSLLSLAPEEGVSAIERYLVTEEILKKITGLQQPDGWAAEALLPPPQSLESFSNKRLLLILDQIADPGNLGTLLRTALALGWEGALFTPGTVDPFNDKALRASKGALFHLPYAHLSPEEIAPWIRAQRIDAIAADTEGEPLDRISCKAPLALILSGEARGPRAWLDAVSRKATIPMAPNVESLNVAASGAILLYALKEKAAV